MDEINPLEEIGALKDRIAVLEAELKDKETFRTNCYLLMSENFKLRRIVEMKDDELKEAAKQIKEEREYSKKVKHAFEKIKVWYNLSEPGGLKYK